MLDNLGLPCVPMLTGGKSLHVIVPLQPKATGETVKLFARTVAVRRSEAAPDRYIATMSKARRKGLIFIDWRRSNRGGTAVGPYALRASLGAKLAVSVIWTELRSVRRAGAFDIRSVKDRQGTPSPLQETTISAVTLGHRVLEWLERCGAAAD
ncbi:MULTISPECIES: hypothetical protein [unclassified Yoonia]|uniref:non-homologous end-joining DNA ligase LigD n=1 Tax=unclassified Yoonia TaxID=2629118 RepID=UPI002AFF15A5|nr:MULTISPECIES: hypothetical protein [unclassified Yoonia]